MGNSTSGANGDGSTEAANDSPIRTIRVALPSSIINDIDDLVASGNGGFRSREQFLLEAASGALAELLHPAETIGKGASPKTHLVTPSTRSVAELTTLSSPPAIEPLAAGLARVLDHAIPGLHNRDYPSLWAARQLADLCVDGPVRWEVVIKRLTANAWDLADALGDRRAEDGSILTALFPSNRSKPQSAESAFRDFAVGKVSDRGSMLVGTGPLFSWRIAQVILREGRLYVGLTAEGLELLGALEGLSLELPHKPDHTRVFFTYLSLNAVADWRALMEVLRLAHTTPTRRDLIDAFLRAQTNWSEAQASTNVSGYVGRCREWGLLAPKLASGRYQITDLGEELLDAAVRAVTGR